MSILAELFKSNFDLYLSISVTNIARFTIFFTVSLICMMTDIGKREIPSILLIILSAIALIVEFFLNKTAFFYCLYGIIFSAAIFFAIYLISKRGIGFGDMFYLIFYSALYGVFFTVNAFLYSFWLGALVLMIPLLLKKIDRKTRIPFVPFLFSGGFIALAASLLIKLIIK